MVSQEELVNRLLNQREMVSGNSMEEKRTEIVALFQKVDKEAIYNILIDNNVGVPQTVAAACLGLEADGPLSQRVATYLKSIEIDEIVQQGVKGVSSSVAMLDILADAGYDTAAKAAEIEHSFSASLDEVTAELPLPELEEDDGRSPGDLLSGNDDGPLFSIRDR